ncbi:6,7-dimethyl-8-ribityllumazine synthase [Teichococcus vastitatis]|jgi:6,7-dimethyl-8-ribityllumazine synthase|uniref:6,7-dimethyl-8-ribityllumazine synthase n=1 Tax=Teichococcus vastitatis TaxID=2307076 RepID=A0ABS9W1F0_9PROT|nr:6,7-dimethyl-8-ribityllumazine synthase [Pseudoroseomonas vastitatis]MCI0752873.1 6,7-dimethyl-8-ribityllumazine synthase [Pseudoroseomonas vastitatis]
MSTIDAPERATPVIPGPAPRILLIQAPYYEAVVSGMRHGAERVLAEAGATLEVVDVAGAFELPAALRMAIRKGGWDGFLLHGCVVKGETDHYQFICEAVCQGVMDISGETGMPLGFGLLTVETLAQAEARSAANRHNKGAEAAHALIGQILLARRWSDA